MEGDVRPRTPSETNALRIALVSPPWYPVPPHGYGGIERVVALLCEELRALGHHVTLFAPEGSSGADEVISLAPAAWCGEIGAYARLETYLLRVHRALRTLDVDVIHDHTDTMGALATALAPPPAPVVATVHGAVPSDLRTLLAEAGDTRHLVALSEAQRAQAPELPWVATVPNAVDIVCDHALDRPRGYLVQLARINRDKGQHLSIAAAHAAGMPLVLAGKLDSVPGMRRYFAAEVQPHLNGRVTWLRDVAGEQRVDLLAGAVAMLFPLQGEEPFGLAMAEAMVCGTPVIAFPRGAAREVVEDGVTGFLVDDVEAMAEAVHRVHQIDRRRCAARARERFAPARMAAGYEQVYRDLRGRRVW
jgi:glycosyltransferase involved in cell wall biosynthesis